MQGVTLRSAVEGKPYKLCTHAGVRVSRGAGSAVVDSRRGDAAAVVLGVLAAARGVAARRVPGCGPSLPSVGSARWR